MKNIIYIFLVVLLWSEANAQPVPGDIFREYVWLPDMVAESEHFLRVGGKLDYKINGDHFPQSMHTDGHIPLDFDLDLQGAVKAELVLEKVQSHEDTKGLQVQINGHEWLNVPDAKGVPVPQSAYMHHFYPVVDIPLDNLKPAQGNTIKLQVDPQQKWDWPQNIFYGFILRIYYNVSKEHTSADITLKSKSDEVILTIKPRKKLGDIRRVEYIGLYEDFNFEGDGIFRQWHYHYHKGNIMNHIGTTDEKPFLYNWDISWVPNQDEPTRIGARIFNDQGIIYFAEANKPLKMPDRPYDIAFYKSYNIPENFVTRSDEFNTNFDINRSLETASAWQIAWVSWSPGYANGIYVNDTKILDKEGPRYVYYVHLHEFDDPKILKEGQNEIKTGLTPLYNGQMVHGMEVQWPGMMLKVKYQK